MTILEKIKFEEDWLSEVNLTKENVRIALDRIKATALEQQQNITNEEMYQQLIHLEAENERLHDALESQPQFYPPCVDCNTKMDEVRKAYDNLSKQRWIPVSERLPEGSEIVLLKLPSHIDENGEEYYSSVVCGHYIGGKDDEWGLSDGATFGYGLLSSRYKTTPIAWQPLPELYKESDNNAKLD